MHTIFNPPNDGGSYEFDPETGRYTQLKPTTAPPEGKSARLAREAAEKQKPTGRRGRGIPNTTDEE